MFVYVEFISRRPMVSLERFHEQAGRIQGEWATSHGDDLMVLNAGRTWRIGPEPEYLCVWYTPRSGLERIDEWEQLFRDAGEAEHHKGFAAVARIDRAGCYLPIGEPTVATEGRYLVEWISYDGVDDQQISALFRDRAARHPQRLLHCLSRPLGALAPDSRGFAVWGLSDWGDGEELALDLPDPSSGVRVTDASLYADFGDEQL
jgi:hypothetical protein